MDKSGERCKEKKKYHICSKRVHQIWDRNFVCTVGGGFFLLLRFRCCNREQWKWIEPWNRLHVWTNFQLFSLFYSYKIYINTTNIVLRSFFFHWIWLQSRLSNGKHSFVWGVFSFFFQEEEEEENLDWIKIKIYSYYFAYGKKASTLHTFARSIHSNKNMERARVSVCASLILCVLCKVSPDEIRRCAIRFQKQQQQ